MHANGRRRSRATFFAQLTSWSFPRKLNTIQEKMSVEKTLEKLLRRDSDANIRFEELCHLLEKRISPAHFKKSSYLHPTWGHRADKPAMRRRQSKAVPGFDKFEKS